MLPKSGAKPLAPTKPLAGSLARGFVFLRSLPSAFLTELRRVVIYLVCDADSVMSFQSILQARVPVNTFTSDIEADALRIDVEALMGARVLTDLVGSLRMRKQVIRIHG